MNAPFFIDAHSHLSDERIFAESESLIQKAKAKQVTQTLLGGVNALEWERQKKLKAQFPDFIKMSFGIHPWEVAKLSDEELEEMLSQLKEALPEAHALGETGLDFHPERTSAFELTRQEQVFRAQVEIAKQANKTIVLHVVRAHEQARNMISELWLDRRPFMLHSFSGTVSDANAWMKLGAYLSFSGVVLREGKHLKTKEVLKQIPLDRVLFETDAPDQSFTRGEPSRIDQVSEIYKYFSDIRSLDLESVCEKMAENFARLG